MLIVGYFRENPCRWYFQICWYVLRIRRLIIWFWYFISMILIGFLVSILFFYDFDRFSYFNLFSMILIGFLISIIFFYDFYRFSHIYCGNSSQKKLFSFQIYKFSEFIGNCMAIASLRFTRPPISAERLHKLFWDKKNCFLFGSEVVASVLGQNSELFQRLKVLHGIQDRIANVPIFANFKYLVLEILNSTQDLSTNGPTFATLNWQTRFYWKCPRACKHLGVVKLPHLPPKNSAASKRYFDPLRRQASADIDGGAQRVSPATRIEPEVLKVSHLPRRASLRCWKCHACHEKMQLRQSVTLNQFDPSRRQASADIYEGTESVTPATQI